MNFEQSENEFVKDKVESSFDFKVFVGKLFSYWPWIVLSVLVSLASAYLITKTTSPQYRSTAKFFIKEKESALALFEKPALTDVGSMGMQNEVIILRSKPLAVRTLNKLDFDVEYYQEGSFTNTRLYKNAPILIQVDWSSSQIIDGLIELQWSSDSTFTLAFIDENYKKYLPDGSYAEFSNIPNPATYNFGKWIENDQFKLNITKIDISQSGKVLFKLRDKRSLAAFYSSNLEVEAVERGASILNLSVVSPHPALGENYLNTLMSTYLEQELSEKNEVYANTIKFIDSQVSGVADSLKFFEKELEAFRSQNKTINLSSEGAAVYDQLSELEGQLKNEEFKRKYYKSLSDYLIRENYKDLVVPSGIGIDDPILNGLIQNLMTLMKKNLFNLKF